MDGLSRLGRCLARSAPFLDGLATLVVFLVTRSSIPAFFGWTSQAPVAFCLLRLGWLALLCFLSVARGKFTSSVAGTVDDILQTVFPYVNYLLLGSLGIVRLVSDQPEGLDPRDDFGFWAASVIGVICLSLESTYTVEVLPMILAWARRRVARTATGEAPSGSLGLLGVEEGAAGVVDINDGSASSSPSAKEKEQKAKKEKEEKERKELEQRRPTVWKLIELVTPDWHLLIQASIFLAFAAVSEVLIPHFIGETIDAIVTGEEKKTLASRPFQQPVMDLILVACCCGVFSACRGATFIWIGGRASIRLRQSLFDALASQEIGFFDTTKTGELTSRMTQDCQKVADQVQLNVNVFLRTLMQTVTTLGFMLVLSPSLTGVAFVSVPVIVVVSKKYGRVMRDISEKTQQALADANAVAEEGMSTMSTVRMFAAEDLESARFAAKLNDFGQLVVRQAGFYLVYMSTTILLPNLVTALVLFYGGKLAMTGQIKAGSLLSFVFYLQTLNNNFNTLGDFYTNMVTAIGAATRVFELRGRIPELSRNPPPGTVVPTEVEGVMRLENIRFTYPARPDAEVLKGLTLDIPAGQVVALVGPSGNGKSTVIGLMKRLYKGQEGRVTLDGVDVWNFPHEDYHRIVSIVGQEPVLYARTIRQNIVYGLENPKEPGSSSISDEVIFEAARKANAHEFILNMQDGYATEVGERGVQLSGGQKQRIAIARAIVRQPKVLLLDEATSALDAESERQVQQAIDVMIADGRMTVIIIAHRLSTVKNAHKICVIQGGQVAEEGTHDELVGRRGAYYKLVECQLSSTPSVADDPSVGA